jgi:prepilin-type N-terminal cleavage/methylation domain-containing protein
MVHRRIPNVGTRGFTLIELVLVVAILGILMVVGMPYFLTYYRTSTLKAGAQELVAVLNQARSLAIKENETVCATTGSLASYRTRIRFVRGNCAATSTCTATGGVSPCIWTGPGTDGSGYVYMSNRIEIRPTAHPTFGYLGAASGSTYTVRAIDNTSGTATVTISASGRITYSFP